MKYKDQNGDNRIDELDVVPMGYNTICPELFYSMGFDFEYKGLGINAQFQGAGHYTIQRSLSCFYAPLMNNQTISEHYLENCWRSGKTIQMLYTRVLQRQKVQITIVEIPYS